MDKYGIISKIKKSLKNDLSFYEENKSKINVSFNEVKLNENNFNYGFELILEYEEVTYLNYIYLNNKNIFLEILNNVYLWEINNIEEEEKNKIICQWLNGFVINCFDKNINVIRNDNKNLYHIKKINIETNQLNINEYEMIEYTINFQELNSSIYFILNKKMFDNQIKIPNFIKNVTVDLKIILGKTELELNNDIIEIDNYIKNQKSLTLNSNFNDEYDLMSGNTIIAKGEIIIVDGNFGIQITKIKGKDF